VAEPGVAPSQWGAQGRSAEAEGRASMGPNHYEYLSSRVHKATADYKALSESLEKRFREQHRTLEQQEKGKKELALQKKVQHLKDTYADWIKQFYEIAERKVSLRDDYGDENWDVASAVQFYSADEGWVITNSTFTKSAKELAQKTGINLIDGYDLSRFAEKYATMPKKNIPSD